MGTDKETTEKEATAQETSEKRTEEAREDSIRRDYGFASDVELKECRYCRVMIPKKAKVCPNCRMSLKRRWIRNTVAVIFAVAVIGVGGYYLSEHWGIMRDAVISVWMAQDSASVPTVSVTTVGTAELAAGAASTGTSEVAVSTGDGGQKDVDTATPEAEAAQDNPSGADRKEGDSVKTLADTTADTPGTAQSKETDRETGNPDQNDQGSAKENSGPDTDEVTDGKDPEEAAVSGQALSDETDEAEDDADTMRVDKDKDGKTEAPGEEEDAVLEEEPDEEEQAFRDRCTEVSYKALIRNTEAYLDTALKVELQVVCQVMGGLFDENVYYLCRVEEVSGIERYYIIRDDREADDILILEGDTLTVYGQVFGNCRLPASLIETRPTVPAVSMLYFDLAEE